MNVNSLVENSTMFLKITCKLDIECILLLWEYLFLSQSNTYNTTTLVEWTVAAQRVGRLRRRNTRYKNPQLVAQHCFVASFGRCLPFFIARNQLVAQQKHLSRVEESYCEK